MNVVPTTASIEILQPISGIAIVPVIVGLQVQFPAALFGKWGFSPELTTLLALHPLKTENRSPVRERMHKISCMHVKAHLTIRRDGLSLIASFEEEQPTCR